MVINQRKNLVDYAVILSDKDNVATALVNLSAGDYVFGSGAGQAAITVPEDVKSGFKLALSDVGKGEPIYKYGYVIGLATENIKKGATVERAIQLHVESGRVSDYLATGKPIGLVRRCGGPENESIEGVHGMNVKVTEVGVSGWICAGPGGSGLAGGLVGSNFCKHTLLEAASSNPRRVGRSAVRL